jgi:hypothetical protein
MAHDPGPSILAVHPSLSSRQLIVSLMFAMLQLIIALPPYSVFLSEYSGGNAWQRL